MRRTVGRKKRSSPKRRTGTRRRRRISGISGGMTGMFMTGLGVGAGAIAARELNAVVVKMVPTLSPMMSGAGQFLIGAFLPTFIKGNKFVSDMGMGMMGNGLMVVAVSTGVISGMGSSSVKYRLNGTSRLNTIAGATGGNLTTIAGRGRKMKVGCY